MNNSTYIPPNLISEQSPGSPNPLFDLAIYPTQPHTNKASCATYSPMDTQPANWIWPPTQPWVCNLINLHIRSHLYTTAETTNHTNPPHHNNPPNKTWKQTNISTYKYWTYLEITLPVVTALHHTRQKYHLVVSSWGWAQGSPKHVEQLIKEK